jgi:hypothetical protein
MDNLLNYNLLAPFFKGELDYRFAAKYMLFKIPTCYLYSEVLH